MSGKRRRAPVSKETSVSVEEAKTTSSRLLPVRPAGLDYLSAYHDWPVPKTPYEMADECQKLHRRLDHSDSLIARELASKMVSHFWQCIRRMEDVQFPEFPEPVVRNAAEGRRAIDDLWRWAQGELNRHQAAKAAVNVIPADLTLVRSFRDVIDRISESMFDLHKADHAQPKDAEACVEICGAIRDLVAEAFNFSFPRLDALAQAFLERLPNEWDGELRKELEEIRMLGDFGKQLVLFPHRRLGPLCDLEKRLENVLATPEKPAAEPGKEGCLPWEGDDAWEDLEPQTRRLLQHMHGLEKDDIDHFAEAIWGKSSRKVTNGAINTAISRANHFLGKCRHQGVLVKVRGEAVVRWE